MKPSTDGLANSARTDSSGVRLKLQARATMPLHRQSASAAAACALDQAAEPAPTAPVAAADEAWLQSFPLIVHSHLRWDFVWQRPQQILSRLAANHPVLFIEEPMAGEAPGLDVSEPVANVVRVVPRLPAPCLGWLPWQSRPDPAALAQRLGLPA